MKQERYDLGARPLRGRVALVTGGAVRIGRAICLELARRGCSVIVHYDRSQRRAESLAARLRSGGVRAWTASGHLGGEADCRRLMRESWAAAGSRCQALQ